MVGNKGNADKTQGVVVKPGASPAAPQAKLITGTGKPQANEVPPKPFPGVPPEPSLPNQTDQTPRTLPDQGQTTTPFRGRERGSNIASDPTKPLFDQTLNKAFRKVLGDIDETSSAGVFAGLNQVTPAAGRTGPKSGLSALSSGATSIAGQSVAQMSLFERALAALSDAEKRLGALKPMQTPDDPENLDALRAITLATYRRLVNEFGRSGGPRPDRVGRYFEVLIGDPEAATLDPNSLIGKIEEQFKIKSGVNSVEDNANVANFRIVKDNLFDVHRSWDAFTSDREEDFGEQAAKFSRFLVMIQNDIAEIEQAMNDLNFDETERDSQPIEKTASINDETITIHGLLSWISEFASEEGPEMVDQGGAIGIEATVPTLVELHELVNTLKGLNEFPVTDSNVQASLGVLLNHLIRAEDLAETIKDRD